MRLEAEIVTETETETETANDQGLFQLVLLHMHHEHLMPIGIGLFLLTVITIIEGAEEEDHQGDAVEQVVDFDIPAGLHCFRIIIHLCSSLVLFYLSFIVILSTRRLMLLFLLESWDCSIL